MDHQREEEVKRLATQAKSKRSSSRKKVLDRARFRSIS